MKTNKSFKSFALKNWKTILVCVIFALTLAGGGLLVVNLTQTQKNLEVVSPVDAPSTAAWSGNAAAFTHGKGTESDPYLIESPENLAYLSVNFSSFNGKYFKQTVDIDLASKPWTPINMSDTNWSCGYNGNGKKITNLKISYDSQTSKCIALFGRINGGYIKDLGIESGSVTGTNMSDCPISALLAITRGNNSIENCYNKATVSVSILSGGSANSVGGLIGCIGAATTSLTIKNCYNTATITNTGSAYTGGIIGRDNSSSCVTYIENCYNTGKITGVNLVGGCFGNLQSVSVVVKNCRNTGAVVASGATSGGFVGHVQQMCYFENCYNSGTCTFNGQWDCGGFAGYFHGWLGSGITLKNCYNTGAVTASVITNSSLGGVVGTAREKVSLYGCYNSGNIKNTVGSCGGVVGYVHSDAQFLASGCYNTGTVTGVGSRNAGIVADCTTTAISVEIYGCYNTGVITGVNYTGGICGLLRASTLAVVENCYNNAKINGSGFECGGIVGMFYPANDNEARFFVDNCHNYGEIVGTARSGGVVGYVYGTTAPLSVTASIKNCTNSGKLSVTTGDHGGILGMMNGNSSCNIYNCHNSGDVVGSVDSGGICGRFDAHASRVSTIQNCTNTGSISTSASSARAGGVCSYVTGPAQILNCTNEGSVTSESNPAGGVIGYIAAGVAVTVKYCCNKGPVKSNHDCGGVVANFNASNSVLSFCCNYGTITGNPNGTSTGGVLGYTNRAMTISYCYNRGYVSANVTGGIVGGLLNGSDYTATTTVNISYCYNASKLSGSHCCGNIFGKQYNKSYGNVVLTNCYGDSSLTANIYGRRDGGTYTETGCSTYPTASMQSTADNTKPGNFANTWTTTQWKFKNGQYPELMFALTKPTLTSYTYTYNEALQNCLIDGFGSTDMEITGVEQVSAAGTYSVTIALKDTATHKWADGTVAPIKLNWTINKASLTKPTVTATNLVFAETVAKTPTIANYDPSKMSLTGTRMATNAGTYKICFEPNENYQWSDSTNNVLEFEWTIAKASIDASALPSQSGTLTYNSNSQNVSWTAYDTNKLTVGGEVSGTNAGIYKATFTPTANYQFSDGAASKQVAWTIAKQVLANPSLNLANNETTFTGTTQDITSVLQNFDSTKMILDGNTQALRAGTYIFIVYLKEEYQNNFVFANGMNFAVISWTILPFNIENGTVSVVGH